MMKISPACAGALLFALLSTFAANLAAERDAAALTPKCDTPTRVGDRGCYLALAAPPDCYVWNPRPQTDETATWSGRCKNHAPDGAGVVTWRWPGGSATDEGAYVAGKRHGPWVLRHGNGTVSEGEYRDGDMHGVWQLRKVE